MRIKIHFTFYLYLFCIYLLSSHQACISVLLTLFTHESCHYAVSRMAGEKIDRLELTPFGGIMTYNSTSTSCKGVKGVCVHVAGPLGNYALLLAAGHPFLQQKLEPEFLRCLIVSNVSMLVLNLLPALPLDGGHIVFCMGYYLLPVAKLISILSMHGIFVGVSGVLITVYSLISMQLFNCSLFLIGIYLTLSAIQCKKTLLAENLYAVVQEQLQPVISPKKINYYQVSSTSHLVDLLPLLKQGVYVIFLFSDIEDTVFSMSEMQFCQALLTSPMDTIAQAYTKILDSKEKNKNPKNNSFPS